MKNEDAVYVLTYSIIMLNTDQHNPQVRVSQFFLFWDKGYVLIKNQKRMTIDDYKRNLRGVNDGADFSSEYLVGAILAKGIARF